MKASRPILIALLGCLALCAGLLSLVRGPAPRRGPAGAPGRTRAEGLDWGDESGRPALAYGRRVALVVGVNHYSGPYPELQGPASDAAEVAAVLASRFGFEEVNLLVDRK